VTAEFEQRLEITQCMSWAIATLTTAIQKPPAEITYAILRMRTNAIEPIIACIQGCAENTGCE
jgi:hypothetical protein